MSHSSTRRYLDFLIAARKEDRLLECSGLTELGWCNAVVVAIQDAGFEASLMQGIGYAYRIPGQPHTHEYQESFSFSFISLPASGMIIDMHGNDTIVQIATQAAAEQGWEYEPGAPLRCTPCSAQKASSLDQDTAQYYEKIHRAIGASLATAIAQDLDKATPGCSSRPRKSRI